MRERGGGGGRWRCSLGFCNWSAVGSFWKGRRAWGVLFVKGGD